LGQIDADWLAIFTADIVKQPRDHVGAVQIALKQPAEIRGAIPPQFEMILALQHLEQAFGRDRQRSIGGEGVEGAAQIGRRAANRG